MGLASLAGTPAATDAVVTPYRRPATMPTPAAPPATRGLWPVFLAVALGSVAFTMCTAETPRDARDAIDHGRAAVWGSQ